MMKKKIAIVGGGPSALALACFLDESKFEVTIYEKNGSIGRKFLVAGKGGFNLTHSENIERFIQRYTPIKFLEDALNNFTNEDTRVWFKEMGIPTIIGSSKRVYPEKGIKPIEVLNAIVTKLEQKNVRFEYNQKWTGWGNSDTLIFNEATVVSPNISVFSLGGGSWKVTGSDGSWLTLFQERGINTHPFSSSNCAYKIDWHIDFLTKHEGKPLKNCALSCGNKTQLGEVVITSFGMEGNAIYALSPMLRKELFSKKKAHLYLDLKPTLDEKSILNKLNSISGNMSNRLRNQLKLSSIQVALLKVSTSKEEFMDSAVISKRVKSIPLTITGAAPLDEAISTVGGVSLDSVNASFELKTLPNQYCIGEMLDWDAPTGGYLLQGCFSMGVWLAKELNNT